MYLYHNKKKAGKVGPFRRWGMWGRAADCEAEIRAAIRSEAG